MIIERICLQDFGIFRNQIMADIHPGLIVILGPNRAGKTTLMQALRHLGYGLPKGSGIPQPSGEQHLINADVRLHDGTRYTIQLTGYAAPRVFPLDGGEALSIKQIFAGLDSYTYKQVFTISLDELRRIPEDTPARDEGHLQAVLLGGGWSDALGLLQIKQEFARHADQIGGSQGKKDVKMFKPYFQKIREGIALRDEANGQLEEYIELKGQLALDQKKLSVLEEALKQKEQDIALHELIRDHWMVSQEIARLTKILELSNNKALLENYPPDALTKSQQLLEEYPGVLQQYETLCRQFEACPGMDKLQAFLDNGETLDAYENNMSGWRQKAETLELSVKEHRRNEAEIALDLRMLDSHLGKDPSQLEHIPLDLLNEEKLFTLLDSHGETGKMLQDCIREIDQTRLALKHREEQARELKTDTSRRFRKIIVLTLTGLMAVLLTAVILGPWEAVGAGAAAGAGMLAYALYDILGPKASMKTNLTNQLDELKERLAVLEPQRTALEGKFQESSKELSEMLECLGLTPTVPYTALPDFIRRVRDLKRRYGTWLAKSEQIREETAQLNQVKGKLDELLAYLGIKLTDDLQYGAGSGSIRTRFDAVERACSCLALARRLQAASLEKQQLEEEICELVQKTQIMPEGAVSFPGDHLREALETLVSKGEDFQQLRQLQQRLRTLEAGLLQTLDTPKNRQLLKAPEGAGHNLLKEIFGRLCSGFQSSQDAGKYCEGLLLEKQKLVEDINEKRNRIPAQQLRLSQLASEEKLHKANRIISEARLPLEEKAEEYAVYRLAELLTENMYKHLIEETKRKVLGSAGDLFSTITSGDYASIDMVEDGSSRDFAAVTTETPEGIGTSALSRGTREQLFLSVRLSRIKGVTPPLPVILDDSLANFDPDHSRQAVGIIADLARTHQVFVLTCHPELVRLIKETGCPAQYWGLNKGTFAGPFAAGDNL